MAVHASYNQRERKIFQQTVHKLTGTQVFAEETSYACLGLSVRLSNCEIVRSHALTGCRLPKVLSWS